MKIAVSSNGPGLNDRIESRFGRCPYFIFVDTETLESDSMPNPNISLGGGAGIQSAQLMAEKGVTTVLTGNCGPNAFKVFEAAGIQVITGVDGIVQDAVQRFKSNQLSASSGPNVQDHFGMSDAGNMGAEGGMGGGRDMGGGRGMGGRGGGMGGGRGMGGGGGRGMGGGGGRGMGGGGGRGMGGGIGMGRGMGIGAPIPDQRANSSQPSRNDLPQKSELNQLRETANDIRRQLAEIESRIEAASGKK